MLVSRAVLASSCPTVLPAPAVSGSSSSSDAQRILAATSHKLSCLTLHPDTDRCALCCLRCPVRCTVAIRGLSGMPSCRQTPHESTWVTREQADAPVAPCYSALASLGEGRAAVSSDAGVWAYDLGPGSTGQGTELLQIQHPFTSWRCASSTQASPVLDRALVTDCRLKPH